jgi:TolB-like protein
LILGVLAAFWVFKSEKNGSQVESQTQQSPKRSVAILPFKNETSDPENDFLCDGLSENLINRLSYLPEIKVMSRSAAFKYKGARRLRRNKQAGNERRGGFVRKIFQKQ